MHSDGAIYPLIPDFIDIGADIFNPVQVKCNGMEDTRRLKREFGKGLTFWGATDTLHVLSIGTPEDIKNEVRRRIDDLAPGGGFVVTPRGPIRPEVPAENLCAIHEAVEAYGRYQRYARGIRAGARSEDKRGLPAAPWARVGRFRVCLLPDPDLSPRGRWGLDRENGRC